MGGEVTRLFAVFAGEPKNEEDSPCFDSTYCQLYFGDALTVPIHFLTCLVVVVAVVVGFSEFHPEVLHFSV